MKRSAIWIVGFLALVSASARAEVFVLQNGSRVEGEWVNRTEWDNAKTPPKSYTVKVGGGEITLDAAQVKEVQSTRPELAEYEKTRAQHADTVDGHWAMAEWCREHKLTDQRQKHLNRVIELDPEHLAARRALQQVKIDGEWMTTDEAREKKGYVRNSKGEWELPQKAELKEEQLQRKQAEAAWFQKVQTLRKALATNKAAQARESLAAIVDPVAISALTRVIKEEQKQGRPEVRTLLVEALAHIGTPEAAAVLATLAMDDPDKEVRLTCLDFLEKKHDPGVVSYFVARLTDKKKNNDIMSRAAVCLGRMKDPSAIRPLIDHLITLQRIQVGPDKPPG
jgi:hypothetical protein